MRNFHTVTTLIPFALVLACGGSPVAPPPPSPPSVTTISPAIGSMGGGASMTIVGAGLRAGAAAIFDGVRVSGRFDPRDAGTRMYLETPPHAAGAVDVVVMNPDGGSVRVPGAHTYTTPEAFDPNGEWTAAAVDGSHRALRFTIRNNALVNASCIADEGPTVPLAVPIPVAVANGEFSLPGPEGVAMFGRIVSATELVGTMNFAPCTGMPWRTYPPQAAQVSIR